MSILKQWHQISYNFDENGLLLFQDVEPGVFTQLKSVDETGILFISHSVISLDLLSCSNPSSHGLFLEVVLHHGLEYSSSGSSLSELYIGHHQMFFIGILEHVSEIIFQLESQ